VSTLDADEMKLSLDLTAVKPGTVSYPLGSSFFNIPRGVTVARITPPVIHLRMEPVIRLTLPVSVRVSGKPAPGYRISQTTVQPARVTVRGPAEEVRRLTAVETVPVDLHETRGIPKRLVRLATDGKPLTLSSDQVEVSVTLEEEQATRDFTQEIGTKDYKGTYTVNPKIIFFRVSGPKNLLDKIQLNTTNVFVNLQGLSVGDHNLQPQFDLPNGVSVVEHKPAMLRVKIIKPGP